MVYYRRKRTYSAPGSSKRMKYMARTRKVARRRVRRRKKGIISARGAPRFNYPVRIKGIGPPQSMLMQFTYRDYFQQNNAQSRHYKLNSMYDIKSLGAGNHQPRYFDEFINANMYRQYVVYRAVVEVTCRNMQGNDVMSVFYVGLGTVIPGFSTSPELTFQNGELPYFTTIVLNDTDAPGARRTFKGDYKPATVYGVKKGDVYTDDIYRNFYNQDAAGPIYLNIGSREEAPGAAAGDDGTQVAIRYEVYIRYFVKLMSLYNSQNPSSSAA